MYWKIQTPVAVSLWAIHATAAALTLAVAALFYGGVYAPWRRDYFDYAQGIQKVSGLTARRQAISHTHRQTVERLATLTTAAEETRKRMPLELSAGEFVEQSTRLAAELGLEVQQFDTGVPQVTEDYATIDVTCRLVGSFASLCRYFSAVDHLPQISKVSQLDLTRSSDPAAYPAQVTFQLYYQVDPHDKDPQRGTP